MMPALTERKQIDITEPLHTTYAVDLWVRNENIYSALRRSLGRVAPEHATRIDPIAVVGFGPSLNETWPQLKRFEFIISSSGAHKFLIERGIVPTYHIEVDPRAHKVALIGPPHKDVEYLIASACSPKVFDHLEGFNVKLWHVFDTSEEGWRTLPPGEWAITGGCSVGLRAMTMARFLGFTDLHLFGIDGSEGTTGKHAAPHPNQAKQSFETTYNGVTYLTTPAFLEAARGTFHELNQMRDVKATFYGEGLVQAMAKDFVPTPHPKGTPEIAFEKPLLVSASYLDMNIRLHRENIAYGVGGGKHAKTVIKLAESLKTRSILDYGCGKSYLQKELDFPIWQYDPAIPEFSASPRPADLVICTDVLEHVEPDKLKYVLKDLQRCVKQVGYFVIDTGPAQKSLPDGRNTHLIQENEAWWKTALSNCFTVAKIFTKGPKLYVLVGPKAVKKKKSVKADTVSVVSADTLKLSFATLQFRHEPYVIGAATEVLSPAHYQELTASFPMDLAIYKSFGEDKKFSLSERNNPEAYHAFVQRSAPWRAFYDYIKAPAFTERMLRVLSAHKIQLPYQASELRSRFEFSLLPADGGCLRPHTDIPSKVVTLVLSMLPTDEDWQAEWGGGTDVLQPKDSSATLADYGADLDLFNVVHTYAYRPNQCVVFIKSDTSWHAVGPLTGPAGKMRRTVTINLEHLS